MKSLAIAKALAILGKVPRANLIESLNDFSFSNDENVIPAHIALKPSTRSGFVDGPDPGVTEIQSFTY